MMTKRRLLIIAIGLATLITIPIVIGAYTMYSNNISFTGTAQAQITLTSNSTSGVAGVDGVRLTASEPSLTGATVAFYSNGTQIGTATSSGGQAIFDYPIPYVGGYIFNATGPHP